jgi:hypothetical protein
MIRSKLSVAMYLLLVFGSGAVVGGLGHRLYTRESAPEPPAKRPSPEEFKKTYLTELKARVGLTDDQVAAAAKVMDDTRSMYHQVDEEWREHWSAKVKAIQESHLQRMYQIFETDQQRQAYDKFQKERESMRRKRDPNKKGGKGNRGFGGGW